MKLAAMKPGARGVVRSLEAGTPDQSILLRLMEMGLTVGATLEIAHEAPFGGAIAVRLRGSLIAIRLEDARSVEVDQT